MPSARHADGVARFWFTLDSYLGMSVIWDQRLGAFAAHSYLYYTLFSCCIFPSLWYMQHGVLCSRDVTYGMSLMRLRIQPCAEG